MIGELDFSFGKTLFASTVLSIRNKFLPALSPVKVKFCYKSI